MAWLAFLVWNGCFIGSLAVVGLGLELLDLKGMGVDLDLTGFNSDEIGELLANAEGGTNGLTDEDAVPEFPEQATTRPGSVDFVLRCWIGMLSCAS